MSEVQGSEYGNQNQVNNVFYQVLKQASVMAKANQVIGPKDYRNNDGLLFCGECNTPKECFVDWDDGSGNTLRTTESCSCKCEQAKQAQEAEERKKRERLEKISSMRKAGFPDEEMQSWTFDQDDSPDSKLSKAARRYVEKFDEMRSRNRGLLLYGPVGTGKSFIGACIANALIEQGVPCMMTNFSRIVNTMQSSFDSRQQYLDSLNQFDLLVIDDLAAERNTEYMQENILSIIDSRYRAKLPLIVTTNLTSQELKSSCDIQKSRIYSRLLEMCIPVEVSGKDRRREKLKQSYYKDIELLGLDEKEDNQSGP